MPDGSPPMGHNSIEVTEADFLKFFADHSDLEEQIEILATKKKRLRKAMRHAGIRLTEFDAMRKFQDMQRKDIEDHFVHLKAYMSWGRVPLGTQFTLDIEPVQDEEPEEKIIARAVEEATSEGFLAGLKNLSPAENPHDGNSEQGQAWLKAHGDGVARREHELSVDPMGEGDDED
ncbi:MAG: hypothetical protein AAF479_08715 [Pseudomonadota bacterium]